jgi:hypothetical protein
MVKVGKKIPKILKRSKVSNPKRLIVGEYWVNISQEPDEKMQPILWT